MENHSALEIDKLLQELQHEEACRRKIAVEELEKLNAVEDRVISALKEAAENDSDQSVRDAAQEALADLGYQLPELQLAPAIEKAEPVSNGGSRKSEFGWIGARVAIVTGLLGTLLALSLGEIVTGNPNIEANPLILFPL